MQATSFLSEDLLGVAEVRELLPAHPHPATIRRWMLIGFQGVLLESTFAGRRRVTSKEAVARFMQRTAALAASNRESTVAG